MHNISKFDSNNLPEKSEELINKVPKEAFKAMFYILAGRPDSVFKSFDRRVIISKEDILELNDSIQEKLKNHNIAAATSSISFSFDNNKAIDFAIWEEFEDKTFNTSDITDEVTIKWDFLIKLPSYSAPQRHTLVVKICSSFSAMQLLQALASKDPSAIDKFELEAVPCFARVDFINHILSEELLRIVEEWNKSRKRPQNVSSMIKWLKRKKSAIALLIHFSMPLAIFLLSFSILYRYSYDFGLVFPVNVLFVRNIMYWLLSTSIGVMVAYFLGGVAASKSYTAISKTGKYHIFKITNGDKNKAEEYEGKQKKLLIIFFVSFIIPQVINIIIAILAAIICKCLKI